MTDERKPTKEEIARMVRLMPEFEAVEAELLEAARGEAWKSKELTALLEATSNREMDFDDYLVALLRMQELLSESQEGETYGRSE